MPQDTTNPRAMTPAQEYREKLKTLTPHERQMRRLEWRWERDIDIWLPMTVRIQKLMRGIQSRFLTETLRAAKQIMYSSSKIILKAGNSILQGNVDEAVSTLSRAIKSDPENKMAHLVRGRGYYILGESDLAINDFSMVLMNSHQNNTSRTNGDLLRVRILLGDIYHRPLTTFDKFKEIVTATLVDSYMDLGIHDTLEMLKFCAFANRGRAHCAVGNFKVIEPANWLQTLWLHPLLN
tara:strand:+ start:212 stop:922 length:711 start_codon:yes stop_codon:yes gene_type:complete